MMNTIDPADWATIWQSELAGLAVDREWQEGLGRAVELWNAAITARHDVAPGRAGPDAAARATAADAAPGARDERDRLRRRVAELEQRLAERGNS